MNANETLYLQSTTRLSRFNFNSFIDFQLLDVPGQIDLFENAGEVESIFSRCGALVFVIDAQDDYLEAVQKLFVTVTRAQKINPNMFFEVLIHKVDGLSYETKIETQRDIHQRINDELSDVGMDHINLFFYLTSIYDHSIYEAFSKIIQKLIPQLPTLENLLNIFCSVCNLPS